MKEENKKTKTTTKKTTEKKPIRKTTTKRGVKKAQKAEPNLNETITNQTVQKEEVIINDNLIECNNCHQKFEKGYSICPHCHKRQTPSVSLTFFIVFAVVFLFGIITFHFVDKYVLKNVVETDYKDTCVLVDYENLVRHPKDYRSKDVKVIGEIVSVEGIDTGYGNNMHITINANLFENGAEHLITIDYSDTTYDQGFIEGDLITVYGTYESINGNIPNINAKFIVFGK